MMLELVREAVCENYKGDACMIGLAVNTAEGPDNDGLYPAYKVIWEADSEMDLQNPDYMEMTGLYDPDTDRVF